MRVRTDRVGKGMRLPVLDQRSEQADMGNTNTGIFSDPFKEYR